MKKILSDRFLFSNKTKSRVSRSLFLRIKNMILGHDYELSVAIVTKKTIHNLNKKWRNKDTPTDILSFYISNNEGEIYICPSEARKEAHKFERSFDNFIAFLFIHGLVHLKGYDHGAIMESIETKFRNKFKV